MAQQRIDWEELKRRVRAAGDALERAGRPSDGAAQRILAERARALAEPISGADRTADVITLLCFAIGRESFALPATNVTEVTRHAGVAALPGPAGPVAGVTVWRGELLTVLNLAGANASAEQVPPWLIVVCGAGSRFGLAADEVSGIVDVATEALHETNVAAPSYVRAVTSELALLDAHQLSRLYR